MSGHTKPVRLGAEWVLLATCYDCGKGVPIRYSGKRLPFEGDVRPGRWYGRCETCDHPAR